MDFTLTSSSYTKSGTYDFDTRKWEVSYTISSNALSYISATVYNKTTTTMTMEDGEEITTTSEARVGGITRNGVKITLSNFQDGGVNGAIFTEFDSIVANIEGGL